MNFLMTLYSPLDQPLLAGKVVFDQAGVCGILPDCENFDKNLCPGRLAVIEKPFGNFVEWGLLDKSEPSASNVENDQNGWVLTESVGFKNGSDQVSSDLTIGKTQHLNKYEFSLDVRDLRSYKCVNQGSEHGDTVVKFMGKDGTNYTPLRFSTGGYDEFVARLQTYVSLKRSAKEPNLVIVSDLKAEALQQSVTMLFEDTSTDVLTKFLSNPVPTALTGFGKVTSFLSNKVIPALMEFDHLGSEEQRNAAAQLKELQKQEDQQSNKIHTHKDDGGFELIVPTVDLPMRPEVLRDPPISQEVWATFVQPDGSVQNVRDLKLRLFKSGLVDEIRPEVWKFLLGYYDWNSTKDERSEMRKSKMDDYFRMKLQWKSISEDQEERFSEFRDRKALVEKDVARTDRTHRFFEGDNNSHVQMLFDILMTYCMYNFDLGYVQGMSDLLSPIMVVMKNEVDTFWAFVGFMDKVFKNFEMDQQHIKNQLMHLRDLLMYINPQLLNYLEVHESDNMYFCFRWLLVLFKREFNFEDIMNLWEVLWTDLPCRNFHLLICLAILDSEKHVIVENRFGLTEILKHINDLSQRIPLEQTLGTAEGMFHQLACSQDKLPPHVCAILGFAPPEPLTTFPVSNSQNLAPRSGSSSAAQTPDHLRSRSPSQNGNSRQSASPATTRRTGALPVKTSGNSAKAIGGGNVHFSQGLPVKPGVATRTLMQTLPD